MSLENNKHLVQHFYCSLIGRGAYTNLADVVAVDYLDHDAKDGGCGPELVCEHVKA